MKTKLNKQFKGNISKDKAKLVEAINFIADTIKSTIGVHGTNAIIDVSHKYVVSNDGIGILMAMRFDDPIYRQAHKILIEIATNANEKSQDGTTTSIVISQSLINAIKNGDMNTKRELELYAEQACKLIDLKYSQSIKKDKQQLFNAAMISAQDSEMAQLVVEVFDTIGENGVVHIEDAKSYNTSWEEKRGLSLSAGFASPYFASDGKSLEIENPAVIITKKKIESVQELLPLLEELRKNNKANIAIFCKDMQQAVMQFLLINKEQGVLNPVVVKMPYGDEHFMEDIAAATGSRVASEEMPDLELSKIGSCEKVVVGEKETRLVGIEDISEYLEGIEDESRKKKLNTRAAVIHLGAKSHAEYSYKKYKIEDTIGTTQLALKHGTVSGGGVCLKDVAKELDLPKTKVARAFKKALEEPFKLLTKKNPSNFDYGEGIDLSTGEKGSVRELGVVDATDVVKNSLNAAISVFATVLTSDIMIYHQPKNNE